MGGVKKRIKIFDIAKGISIILMTITHYPFFLNNDIYPNLSAFNKAVVVFKMPLFIFISGYLFSNRLSFYKFTYSKIDGLLKPLFGFIIALTFMNIVFYTITSDNFTLKGVLTNLNSILCILIYGNIGFVNYALWFVIALFLSLIVFKSILAFHKKSFINKYFYFCIVISFLIVLNESKLKYFYFGHIPVFTTYLACGYFFKKYTNKLSIGHNAFYNKFLILLPILFIVIIKTSAYTDYINVKLDLFKFIYNYHYMLIISLIGVLGMIHLCTYIEKINILSSVLVYCSKASFFILAFHVFFIDLFRFYFNLETYNPWFHTLLFFSNIAICCLIYELIKKVPLLRLFFYPLKTITFTSLELRLLKGKLVTKFIPKSFASVVKV